MTLSLLLAAPVIGLLLSLFAAGGGMLAVPLLSYGLGMPFKQAVVTSLAIVATVSLIALLQNQRWKLIDWHLHRFFAFGGVVGGIVGARVGLFIPDQLQAILFAIMLLLVTGWIHSDHMEQTHVANREMPCSCPAAIFAGIAAGLVTGLLGVGGGFIIVPILLMLGAGSYQSAIAHSLLLIISNSMVSVLGYVGSLEISWHPVTLIVALAALGSWLGSHISVRYSSKHLQKLFGHVLLLMSGWVLYRALIQ